MENENEQLNSGIKDIRNIKMTDNEKNQIFQSVIGSAKIQEIKKEKKHNIFQMFPNYSLYMRTAVYFILLASVGGLFWFNYQSINPKPNTTMDNYKTPTINAPFIENKNSQQTESPTLNTQTTTQTTSPTPTSTNKNSNLNTNYLNAPKTTANIQHNAALVYKTRSNYANNISVCYSNGEITCFPGPTDAIHQRPIPLSNGYFIKTSSGNVFSSITIDELVNYKGDWAELGLIDTRNIIDYHPFLEIYRCPANYNSNQEVNTLEINKIIESGELKTKCENVIDEY